MKAIELLSPRYEVIASCPKSNYSIGSIIDEGTDHINIVTREDKYDDYPHIFRRMNWWEKRTKEQMPKKLVSLASKDNEDFRFDEQEVFEILDWDMNGMMGYLNIEKRQVCDLTLWSPEYGYIPVD